MDVSGSTSANLCQICGSPDGKYHFGAITCRACAAFFRRYVNSKNPKASCRCGSKKISKYPCRLCRLQKCESFGMKTSLVQLRREPYSSPKIEGISLKNSVIEKPIALRTMERLENVEKNYSILGDDRNCLRDDDNTIKKVNFYEISMFCAHDAKFISKMIERAFPEVSTLSAFEKKTMFANFYTKWVLIECVLFAEKVDDIYIVKTPIGQEFASIENFYISSRNDNSITQNDITRIFAPYWAFYEGYLVPQIYERKLNNIEYMALLALTFLDPGYSNLSNKCVELCHKLRSLYLRELSAYYSEINLENSENRFFDVLDILRLLERAEVKAQEELQMCCIYDVMVNDVYRNLVLSQKY